MNEIKSRQEQKSNFRLFHNNIGAASIRAIEGNFKRGWHIDNLCDRLQNNNRTATLAFRKSSKSVTMYTFVMWLLLNSNRPFNEYRYFSYKQDRAREHLQKIKRYIAANPLYTGFKSLTQAETILRYKTKFGEFEVKPEGILAFKRGLHPDGVFLDDILKDPTERLDLTQIEKITRIVLEEVLSMPKEGGCTHLIGTAQDQTDIFHVLKEPGRGFNFAEYPAIKDGNSLWPEMFPLERLEQIRLEITDKPFQKEFLLVPVRSADAWFSEDRIFELTNPKLKNLRLGLTYNITEEAYAGADLGKKRHPSHLAVFKETAEGKLIQIHSHWFDRIDYCDQLAYFKQAIETFGIRKLKFDNTRAEMTALDEMGEIPREMEGVSFTGKENFKMAGEFERLVSRGQIEFLDDLRQRRSICSVDNNLKAPETSEGHGDSFWACALAISAAMKKKITYGIWTS